MASAMLEAELRLTARDATAAGLNSATRNVRRASTELGRIAATMGKFALGYLTADAAVRGVKALGTAAVEVDRSMKSLMITSGATAETIKTTFRDLTASGAIVHTSGRRLLEISNTLVAAGLSLEDATGSAASASRLALAYDADIEDIGNLTASMFTGFGANVAQVDRYFDAVATGSKAGQIEVKDLAAGVGDLAGSAQLLGMDSLDGFQKLVAFAEVSRKTASDNSSAINNVRNALDKMMAPDVQKNFKKMGVDWQKSMKEGAKSGKDLLTVLRDAVMTATKGDMTKVSALFPDAQARAAVAALIGNYDEYQRILNDIQHKTGVVAADAAKSIDTISGAVDRASEAWSNWVDMIASGDLGKAMKSAATGTAEGLEAMTLRQTARDRYAEALLAETGQRPTLDSLLRGDIANSIEAIVARQIAGKTTAEQGKTAAAVLAEYAWGKRTDGSTGYLGRAAAAEADRESGRAGAYARLSGGVPFPTARPSQTMPTAAAVLDESTARFLGAFDDATRGIESAARSLGYFDPGTAPYDPGIKPSLPMIGFGNSYSLRRFQGATPMAKSNAPDPFVGLQSALDALRSPGALKAEVQGPVEAQLKGAADVRIEIKAPPGMLAGASSSSSGHIRTNVGTSMPWIERKPDRRDE